MTEDKDYYFHHTGTIHRLEEVKSRNSWYKIYTECGFEVAFFGGRGPILLTEKQVEEKSEVCLCGNCENTIS